MGALQPLRCDGRSEAIARGEALTCGLLGYRTALDIQMVEGCAISVELGGELPPMWLDMRQAVLAVRILADVLGDAKVMKAHARSDEGGALREGDAQRPLLGCHRAASRRSAA